MEAEKADLERRMQKSPYPSSTHANLLSPTGGMGNFDQVDVVRSQILSSSGGQTNHQRLVEGAGQYRRNVHIGENVVKIRILEQENERFLRKIRGLEAQLSELERVHGGRIQELLGKKTKDFLFPLYALFSSYHGKTQG